MLVLKFSSLANSSIDLINYLLRGSAESLFANQLFISPMKLIVTCKKDKHHLMSKAKHPYLSCLLTSLFGSIHSSLIFCHPVSVKLMESNSDTKHSFNSLTSMIRNQNPISSTISYPGFSRFSERHAVREIQYVINQSMI